MQFTDWSYLERALAKLWKGFLAALADDTSDPFFFLLKCIGKQKIKNFIYADQVSSQLTFSVFFLLLIMVDLLRRLGTTAENQKSHGHRKTWFS
jgi:hypothetical protein